MSTDCASLGSNFVTCVENEQMNTVVHFLNSTYSVKGKKILDIGGHTGLLAYRLQNLGALSMYLDIDPTATEYSLITQGPDRWSVPFIFADLGQPIEFLSGQFNIVTCLSTLEYIPEKNILAAIRNIKTFVAEHGNVCISIDCAKSPKDVQWWYSEFVRNGLYIDTDRITQSIEGVAGTVFLLRKLL